MQGAYLSLATGYMADAKISAAAADLEAFEAAAPADTPPWASRKSV